jgi:DNA polymerase III epsilon subunit-like protein
MKSLIFDVETTGLPIGKNVPIHKTEFYPFIVQFSWMIYDNKLMKIEKISDYIIKLPDGEIIPDSSIKIHGVTNERVKEEGVDIVKVLRKFTRDMLDSDILVAHNLEFDKSIIEVEYLRNNKIDWLGRHRKKEYCTLKHSIDICKLLRKGKNGSEYFKWPKLMELHQHFYRKIPNNLHNSLVDIFVCFRCFHQLYYGKDILRKHVELRHYYNDLCGFKYKM